MSVRERWLEKGLDVLAREGHRAVTIDRLCNELSLTKGSFYHHFSGVADFEAAMLEHFSYRETQRYVELAEAGAGDAPQQRIKRLQAAVVRGGAGSASLEVAVRGWATQDAVARTALEEIDRRRLDYLESVLQDMTSSKSEARAVARMIYLVLIGGYHHLPPMPMREISRLWDRILATLES
ncbi:AcrR family transcriptional regulator [Nocardioides thalensis]|uniref:AcrR family transcriptional regulator n=1 Tax=Nocardioides thalensis TaxID=1914755 RepID=A0A853C6E6_9ACTN|nr:TetR/AcrR family transcriptional regulator [Nocardioides thalensis]NYJ03630.1 AcrR family transcriptional regulator [Nocardioides thalensis]